MQPAKKSPIDVLGHARQIMYGSKVLKSLRDSICFPEDCELQCLRKKGERWQKVDVGIRYGSRNEKFDAMQNNSFDRSCYRVVIPCDEPINGIDHLCEGQRIADTIAIFVKTFADQAQITVQLIMISRDLGYEETVVHACMFSTETGKWLEKHNQFPNASQFDQTLAKCLKQMGLQKESDTKEDDDLNEDPDEDIKKELARQNLAKNRVFSNECDDVDEDDSEIDEVQARVVVPKRSRSRSRDAKKDYRSRSMSPISIV
jgi:hypothetical protein